jgi:hypothetical protein
MLQFKKTIYKFARRFITLQGKFNFTRQVILLEVK